MACEVVKDVVETVHRYRGGEVAMNLIDIILVKHGVRPGRSNHKRSHLMAVLDHLGWVTVRVRAWNKVRATGYWVGERLEYKDTI